MDRLRGTLKFDYDHASDVLYSYVNKPRRAYTKETANGNIFLRVDPTTQKLVGFTIVGYREKLRKGLLHQIPHFGQVDLPVPKK